MVGHSTKNNKTNNDLSPQIIEHKKYFEKGCWKSRSCLMDRHKNVAELNQLMASQTLTLYTPTAIQI
jgi:hypothetical protein